MKIKINNNTESTVCFEFDSKNSVINFTVEKSNSTQGRKGSDSENYVDLGLPSGTRWAKRNVGASKETDFGEYYTFDEANKIKGVILPTREQLRELRDNTIYEWTTINDVEGSKFTAQNGNYIFIPAAGGHYDGGLYGVGTYGCLRSSSSDDSNYAYFLEFNDGYVNGVPRDLGCSVRGVLG